MPVPSANEPLAGCQLSVCDDSDLVTLRARWPTADDVHGAHYAEQRQTTATYLVAWQDREPLGSALVQWRGPVGSSARASFPRSIEVNHLQVRPEYRGSGVGTLLLAAAERLMLSRGCDESAVSVDVANHAARRLYDRLGYTGTGVLDDCVYYWTDNEGQRHRAVETNELLVKSLPWATSATDGSVPPEERSR